MLSSDQKDTLALWYVVNMSLTSFYKLVNAFDGAGNALKAAHQNLENWQRLGIHKSHLSRFLDLSSLNAFLYRIEEHYDKEMFGLIFSGENDYPESLYQLYDPPPVLFFKGNKQRLKQTQLAIVGTRKPSDYAQKITFDLAQYLVQAGFVITSGLALGVDSFAHQGALAQDGEDFLGYTVGVMGTGIDVCYPPQNQGLFFDIIQSGGCLISELLPATPASKHTFPRRNRIVTGLSLATIVTEATLKSGSLVSARLAAEQGKQVFVVPNRIDNSNSEGCHHLIREGATLIYHPNHIIEELQTYQSVLPTTFSKADTLYKTDGSEKQSATNSLSKAIDGKEPEMPIHLKAVYVLLDHTPQTLDALVEKSGLAAGELLAKLTELEIYGLLKQSGGCYEKS